MNPTPLNQIITQLLNVAIPKSDEQQHMLHGHGSETSKPNVLAEASYCKLKLNKNLNIKEHMSNIWGWLLGL